jgi:hypothetical protein
MIWRRSQCVDGQAGEAGRCSPLLAPFGGEEGGAFARSLARVGACAGELRLMAIERDGVPADVSRAGGGEVPSKNNR